MNDTEILNKLQTAMRVSVRWQHPASPRLLGDWADWIDRERQPERRDDMKWTDADRRDWYIGTRGVKLTDATTQRFWRCKHYPSAIDNWHAWEHAIHPEPARYGCEHGCDKSELRWSDNGTNATPS